MIIRSAIYGMKLWAMQLIPALFPFMILTSLFLWFQDKYCSDINNSRVYRLLGHLWNLSPNGIYILLLGHICGYPSAAKMIRDLNKEQKLTENESNYLLTIANQSSPAFIDSYFITYALGMSGSKIRLFILLYLSTFLTSLITRLIFSEKHQKQNKKHVPSDRSNASHASDSFFYVLDNSIVSSASVCIKIGGYIILFSVLSTAVMQVLSFIAPANQLIASSLELTYGLSILKSYPISNFAKELLLLGCFCFGGICTMAQIKGMLIGTSLTIKPYLLGKCIYTMIVLILYILFI